jgi:hypothetical protein
MRKLLILSRALGKGFVRGRASLFFSVVFPLMFLVLFGGVFNVGTLKTSLIEIGKVPLFNAQIKQEYKDAVRFKQYDSRSRRSPKYARVSTWPPAGRTEWQPTGCALHGKRRCAGR